MTALRRAALAGLVVLLAAVVGVGGATTASAHPLSATAILLSVGDTGVTGEVELPVDRLALALEDPTLTPQAALVPAELATLRTYVGAHTAATGADGAPWSVAVTGGRIESIDAVDHLVLDLALTPPGGRVGDFTLSYDAVVEHLLSHRILVSERARGAADYTTVGVIDWQEHDLAVPAGSSAATGATQRTGFLTAVHLGVEHISGGADHLLFLVMLLLPAPLVARAGSWVRRGDLRRACWRVVHVVTAFALGHSTTLALAALGYLHVNTRLVESLIAVSILASAVHAIKPLVPGGEAAIAAGFGLVHGLAFAALIDTLGLRRGSLVVELLGFNLGIEVTQLLVVALVMPSLLVLSRTRLFPAVRTTTAATGAVLALADELPAIDGVAEHWGRGVVHCPFCHGFEVRDQRLVQIVTHPLGLHPTPLFRHLTEALTVVLHDPAGLDEGVLDALTASGVIVERSEVSRVVTGPDGEVSGVELGDGRVLEADAVVVGSRFRARADVLAGVGLATTAHPSGAGDVLAVDPRGRSAVPGVYAAGNVTDPSLQVLTSAAQGSQVGAMIAFSLAEEDLGDAARRCGEEADWDHRYGGPDRAWSGNPNGTLVHEVTDLVPGRALDVGAGEGADALWLAERGWKVTATDISGNALARVRAEAERRGLAVDLVRSDAGDADPFGGETFDLVSLQYGSFKRTPDQRGLRSLLEAVAPGGTLLVVHHDLTPVREPVDVATQTRMYDPEAFVGVGEVAAALATDLDTWHVEVHETRPRPPGAASTHHVDDIVLRATRRTA